MHTNEPIVHLPAFYRDIITNLCAIIYILDLKTNNYTWGNNKYFDIFGYKENEIITNAIDFAENLFHPDDKKIVRERIDFFKENKGDVWAGVYRIKHKAGHWVWVYSKVSVYKRDSNLQPAQLIGIIIDAQEQFETKDRFFTLLKERNKISNKDILSKLTTRELEIIALIASGKCYHEIADMLSIQPDTVNKHRKNILDKLDLNNIASLVCFAKETGLA